LMDAGRPSHLWFAGMEAMGSIVGPTGATEVVCDVVDVVVAVSDGVGACVLAVTSTFSKTKKPDTS